MDGLWVDSFLKTKGILVHLTHSQSNCETQLRSNGASGRPWTGISPPCPHPSAFLLRHQSCQWPSLRGEFKFCDTKVLLDLEQKQNVCHGHTYHAASFRCSKKAPLTIRTLFSIGSGQNLGQPCPTRVGTHNETYQPPCSRGHQDFRSQWTLVLTCLLKMSWPSSQEPPTFYRSSHPQRA